MVLVSRNKLRFTPSNIVQQITGIIAARTRLAVYKKSMLSRSGFTLAEILVAVFLTGTIALGASTSLFTLLKNATKAELIKEIRQNGDYALSVMEIKIRNARDVLSACTSAGSSSQSITIENQDATVTSFSCVPDGTLYRIIEQTSTINYLTNTYVTVETDCATGFTVLCKTTAADTRSKEVQITFSLVQPHNSASSAEQAQQTFSTSILLRNK